MAAELITLELRDRRRWRTWLGTHHASSPGVWLVFYKDHTGMKSIAHEDSVREALCFGWIDSLRANPQAWSFFQKLAPGYRRHFVVWIHMAKGTETREKRTRESIALLADGKKLGLK